MNHSRPYCHFRDRLIGSTVRLFNRRTVVVCLAMVVFLTMIGCGTTKWSDTSRTATEQLLISSAMDDAIDEYDFYPLTGRKIFIESKGVAATDKEYLLTILRQQLAANGVFIQETKDTADYILEVATGAVGTNRYDLMYGIPETTVPSILGSASTSIPEVPFIKRTDQKAQVKLTMWAYNKTTGAIIWQSGEKLKSSWIRDRWVLGAGPFTKNSFSEVTEVGGREVKINSFFDQRISGDEHPSVRTEAVYRELDTKAIDHLEEIRKEGILAMTKKSPEANETETAQGEKNAEGTEGTESGEGEPAVAEGENGDEKVEKTAAKEEPPIVEDTTSKATAGPLVQNAPKNATLRADELTDPLEVPTLTVVTIPEPVAASAVQPAIVASVPTAPAPAPASVPISVPASVPASVPMSSPIAAPTSTPAIGQSAAPTAARSTTSTPRLNLGDVSLPLGQPVQLLR